MASDQGSSGSTLPGFAGITEGTLGDREGAVAMMGMSSPTGYLDLIQPAISSATQTGSGSVGGVAVTNYTVSNDLDQLAGAAGTSSAEAQTITSALNLLKSQGYTTNSAVVSIDAAGFIRQVKSTDTFSDGGTVTLSASFSNFGCAGTILMPGQTGAGVPPAGCTSPDSPNSDHHLDHGSAQPQGGADDDPGFDRHDRRRPVDDDLERRIHDVHRRTGIGVVVDYPDRAARPLVLHSLGWCRPVTARSAAGPRVWSGVRRTGPDVCRTGAPSPRPRLCQALSAVPATPDALAPGRTITRATARSRRRIGDRSLGP